MCLALGHNLGDVGFEPRPLESVFFTLPLGYNTPHQCLFLLVFFFLLGAWKLSCRVQNFYMYFDCWTSYQSIF